MADSQRALRAPLPSAYGLQPTALWRVLAAAACFASALAWAQSLEVIQLKHRSAEDVIPILQPLVEPGGALSGKDYTLFVRASSANVAQLRLALAQIDHAPRQFLISVRQATEQEMEREGVSASGTIHSGGADVSVRATDSTDRRRGGSVASVNVLEGGSAYVAAGSSVPIVTTIATGGGRRPWAVGSTSYRDLESGFIVTPRAAGDAVTLEIEQQAESVYGGQIQTQHLTTQISARPGEWVRLGGVSESVRSEERGILHRRHQTSSDERAVWVKVEVR